MTDMDRRAFLLAGAGLAIAAACGGKGDDDAVAKVSDPSGAAGKKKSLNVAVATYWHMTGIEERITVGLINAEGTGPLPLTEPVALTIDGQSVVSSVHTDGTPMPYLLVHHRFAEPGVVTVGATYKGQKGEAALQVLDGRGVKVPYRSRPMIATPSPTPSAPMGVDPICTADPPCGLHEVSLDAALAEKRPLAVLFSTPARCMSRFCGPVLDSLLAQQGAYADRVRFLHVEIYKDRTSQDLAPTVEAYGLQMEPVLFLAGADGVVHERLDNAYDRVELKDALDRLVS